MKRSEIAMLLTMAKATDDRIVIDEGRVIAWEATLDGDIPFDWAKQGLSAHYADRETVIMPSNLNERWRLEKRRLQERQSAQAFLGELREVEARKADPAPYIAQIRAALSRKKANMDILSVECPTCHAVMQESCIAADYPHPARVDVAREHVKEAVNG